MIRFSVNLDPQNNVTRVKSIPESPEPILVGREKECQLRLRHNSVSRKHCQIEFTGNGYLIEDLGSTQGTYLNGKKLTPLVSTPLNHGDKLLIGELEVAVAVLEEPEAANQISDAAHDAVADLLGKFMQNNQETDTTTYIKLLNGDDEGVKFLLVSGNEWTLGRSEESSFVIHNPNISRIHCRITLDDGGYYIEDMDSQNGTEINGSVIKGKQRLVHLDRFKMGPIKAIFFDPSQELLSALEFVEQSNEPSETKAVDLNPAKNSNSPAPLRQASTVVGSNSRRRGGGKADTHPDYPIEAVSANNIDGNTQRNVSTFVDHSLEEEAKARKAVNDANSLDQKTEEQFDIHSEFVIEPSNSQSSSHSGLLGVSDGPSFADDDADCLPNQDSTQPTHTETAPATPPVINNTIKGQANIPTNVRVQRKLQYKIPRAALAIIISCSVLICLSLLVIIFL